jgi:PhnB protein
MASLNPYLNFNGNTEEVFTFYKSVFGTEYQVVMRFKDVPAEFQGPESDQEKIMHISLPIGGGTVLMGSDVPEKMGKVTTGTNFYISLSTDSQEEADKLFNGLSAGGHVFMPLGKTFWGSYFGMLKDKFDVQWMVSYDVNPQ